MANRSVILELIVQDKNSAKVVTRLNKKFAQLEKSAVGFSQKLDRGLENLDLDTLNKVGRFTTKYKNALDGASSSTTNFRKVSGNANQVMFAFGDAVNDAAFAGGNLAQTARFAGNNIAFAAESFSNVVTRAGSARGAFKALASSFLGTGGLILLLNVGITLLNLFGDELTGAGEDADALKEELEGLLGVIDSLSKALKSEGFFGDDPFNVQELTFQRERLEREAATMERIVNELSGGFDEQARRRLAVLEGQRASPGFVLTPQQSAELARLQELEKQYDLNRGVISEYETQIEGLQERIKELNTEIRDQTRAQAEFQSVMGRGTGVDRSSMFSLPGERPEDVIFQDLLGQGGSTFSELSSDQIAQGLDLDLGKKIFPPGSLGALRERLQKLREELLFATDPSTVERLKNEIGSLEGRIGSAGNSGTQEFSALTSAANLFGSAIAQSIIQGRELVGVLENLAAQLASRAIITGLGALLTGGASLGGGSFLAAMFGGFAHGTDAGFPGMGMVGERGPEMIVAPPMSSVITNENVQALARMRSEASEGAAAVSGIGAGAGIEQAVERAIQRGLEGATIHNSLSLSELAKGMTDFKELQNRIGNG